MKRYQFEPKELRKIYTVEYVVGLHPTKFPPEPIKKRHYLKKENLDDLDRRKNKAKNEIRGKKRKLLLKKIKK